VKVNVNMYQSFLSTVRVTLEDHLIKYLGNIFISMCVGIYVVSFSLLFALQTSASDLDIFYWAHDSLQFPFVYPKINLSIYTLQ
jgi:hypothetical protein